MAERIAATASSQNSVVSNTSSGVKRKRSADIKFYAVRVGRKPGVYHSWADCLAQVKGFKNATFKAFPSLSDAEAFVQGLPASRSSEPKKFYAVANGRRPGVYSDWSSALDQIRGWTKPLHRSFATRAEAEAFVRNHTAKTSTPTEHTAAGPTVPSNVDGFSAVERKVKKAAIPVVEEPALQIPGWDPLPLDAVDGFDNRIILDQNGTLRYKTQEEMEALKFRAKVDPSADVLEVWTDGACRNNGKAGAIAGVGVYFGRNDPRNISEPLQGHRQTNQRAELTAIKRALDMTPWNRSVKIYSDSNYAIKCVTEWSKTWIQNGWISSTKKSVENKDLIEEILNMIKERDRAQSSTTFVWVKGHNEDPGNMAADELAVTGAMEAKANGVGKAESSITVTPKEVLYRT